MTCLEVSQTRQNRGVEVRTQPVEVSPLPLPRRQLCRAKKARDSAGDPEFKPQLCHHLPAHPLLAPGRPSTPLRLSFLFCKMGKLNQCQDFMS